MTRPGLVACIVPARLASSRFPRKPLAAICGKAMVLHVLDRACAADCFGAVVCATDSEEIADVVRSAGHDVVLTSQTCATGSDRVRAAAALLDFGSVVNLQGDEPLADPAVLREVCASLRQHPGEWTTVSSPLEIGDWEDSNTVKLNASPDGRVLAFSRKPGGEPAGWRVHRGVYAYSRSLLDHFCTSPRTRAEREQSLEQLRVFPAVGFRVVHSTQPSRSVDVPADIARVEAILNRTLE